MSESLAPGMLSKRLQALAAEIPSGSVPADIGTDHALLPLYLVRSGLCRRAIAGDVNRGPYETARLAVQQAGLEEQISVRHGNGLEVVTPGEADVLVLAGMGAVTMIQIFEARPEVVAAARRLVLQPMVGAPQLRRWLQAQGFALVAERLLAEEGRLYEVLVAEPGDTSLGIEEILQEIGPLLWAQRHPLLPQLLAERLRQDRQIAAAMEKSREAVGSPRYQELRKRIAALEEKRRCL